MKSRFSRLKFSTQALKNKIFGKYAGRKIGNSPRFSFGESPNLKISDFAEKGPALAGQNARNAYVRRKILPVHKQDLAGIEVHTQRLALVRELVGRQTDLVDLPLQAGGGIRTRRVEQH